MPTPKSDAGDIGQRELSLTVARVYEAPDHTTVKFFESARIYRMPRSNADYAQALRTLRAAAASGTVVRVVLVEAHGDVIEAVVARE